MLIIERKVFESFYNIETLKNDTDEYANWDSTYEFMKNKNKQYIYENFRDGVDSILNTNLNGIIYVNPKNKLIFSRYSNEFLNANKKNFEDFLIEKFKDIDTVNTVVNYNSKSCTQS